MPEEHVEDGLTYFGRYYRLEPGQEYPDIVGGPIIDLDFLFGLTFRADDGWFAIALAVHNEDRAMRALLDENAFEAALQAIPRTAAWRRPGQSRPMTEVKTMSSIDDRWRDFVVDGVPRATGIVAVGDSLIATNPALGRGASLAWIAARALGDVVAEHGDDPMATTTAYDHAMRTLIRPWFDQTAQMDAERLVQMRRLLAGQPAPEPDENDPTAAFAQGFFLGSQVDAGLYRAMGQVAHLMKQPIELLEDPDLATAAIDAYQRRAELEQPSAGPTRDGLLAAMAGATEGSPAAAD